MTVSTIFFWYIGCCHPETGKRLQEYIEWDNRAVDTLPKLHLTCTKLLHFVLIVKDKIVLLDERHQNEDRLFPLIKGGFRGVVLLLGG